MNRELRDKWVAALRSGDYEQGDGYLCVEYADGKKAYCCLGVLSDLMGRLHRSVGGSSVCDEGDEYYFDDTGVYYGSDEYPSVQTLALAEVPHSAARELADMNDGRHGEDGAPASFEVIADWIERNL